MTPDRIAELRREILDEVRSLHHFAPIADHPAMTPKVERDIEAVAEMLDELERATIERCAAALEAANWRGEVVGQVDL